jgi:hypothetical protein
MPLGHRDLSPLSGTHSRKRGFHVVFDGQRQLGGVPTMPDGHVSVTQRRWRQFHHVFDGQRQS